MNWIFIQEFLNCYESAVYVAFACFNIYKSLVVWVFSKLRHIAGRTATLIAAKATAVPQGNKAQGTTL